MSLGTCTRYYIFIKIVHLTRSESVVIVPVHKYYNDLFSNSNRNSRRFCNLFFENIVCSRSPFAERFVEIISNFFSQRVYRYLPISIAKKIFYTSHPVPIL